MNNLEFIIQVKELSISKICKENNVDYTNLIKGRLSKEKENLITDIIKSKIIKIYSSLILGKRIE